MIGGEGHPGTINTLSLVRSVWRGLGQHSKAEVAETQALESCRKNQGYRDRNTIALMANLASSQRSLEKHAEAEEGRCESWH